MQIIEGKALLLKLKNPETVTNNISKSSIVGDNEVLVSWGLQEAHTLNSLNIKAPSPITAQYNWPGQHKPFDHFSFPHP